MVLAGTGKKGKTKEVVKDREGKTVGSMYVCMHACMHACMYVCTYVYMYVQYHKCHACHANDGRCEIVPRLPRETKVGCQVVPRLPRKVARRPGAKSRPKGATQYHKCQRLPRKTTVRCEIVPRLPRETKVDVRLCHACHAKWRGARRQIPAQGRHPVP